MKLTKRKVAFALTLMILVIAGTVWLVHRAQWTESRPISWRP